MSIQQRSANGISQRHRGSALVVALFLIVVVAALGVLAMQIGSNQQQTANLALLISRANAAAFSGLEYGARRAKSGGLVCGALPAINGFNVVVTGCNVNVMHSVGGTPYNSYIIISTATCATAAYGNPDFVQRQMTREVSEIPAATGGTWESGAHY